MPTKSEWKAALLKQAREVGPTSITTECVVLCIAKQFGAWHPFKYDSMTPVFAANDTNDREGLIRAIEALDVEEAAE